MHKLTRWSGLLLLVAAVSLPAFADKAKSLYNQGKEAEARQDYVQAYEDYRQAYNLKPSDLYYRTAFERLRFLAAATKVHQGQLLRQAGQLQVALKMFEQAAAIDPSSFIATQEIKRTQDMIQQAQAAGKEVPPPAPQGPLGKMLQEAGGPVELAPISNTPITLKMTEDSKVAYDTVGKLAGINVLFDPDYTSRRIHIELNGVTLQQALE
ncbi:MAG: type II and III secretion system protein, partial [Acidobacteriota bacterium]